MDLVTQIFATLGLIATEVTDWFAGLFAGATEIFYTPGVAEDPGELTLIGVLTLVALGIAAFWLIFNFIRNLVKLKG